MSDWFATLAWLKSKDMLRDTDSQIHSDYRWLYSPLIQRPAHIHHCPALTRSLSVSLSQFLSLSRSVWVVRDTQREEGLSEEWPCAMPFIHQPSFSPQERWMKAKKGRERERTRESNGDTERDTECVCLIQHICFFFHNCKVNAKASINRLNTRDLYKPKSETINTSTHMIFP